jgi:hypothetical protein
MDEAPQFQYDEGYFCFRNDDVEVHIDEMTFDEYLYAYLEKHGIDTRTQEELLASVSHVGQQHFEAENVLHHADYWRSFSDSRIRLLDLKQQKGERTSSNETE